MTDPDPLEAHFTAARRTAPDPSEALLARIAEDAAREADMHRAAASRREGPPPRGRVGGLFHGLGGWPAVAGLTCVGIAGIWIGAAAPGGFDPVMLIDAYRLDPNGLNVGYPDLSWSDG